MTSAGRRYRCLRGSVLAVLLASQGAWAGQPPAVDPEGGTDPYDGPAPIQDEEKRELPDYDGRGEPPAEPGDVALWVPRVLLYPAYLVSEYLVRWPLGKLVTAAEKHDLPAILVDFFTFGPEQQAGIVPTALVDFGLRTSVGFYFFWDDYLAKGQDLRFRAATGGADWFRVNALHRSWLDAAEQAGSAEARFEYSLRPDWVHHGIGPRAAADAESVFRAQRIEGGLRLRSRYFRTSTVEAYAAVRDVTFHDQGCCSPDDVRLGTRVGEGAFPFPPGWEDGYTVALQRVDASLDTRELRDSHVGEGSDFESPPGTGIRVALRGQLAQGVRDSPRPTPNGPDRYAWVTYGGTLGSFVDLNQKQRVIGVSTIVDFADPMLAGSEIPFTELVSLGGDRPLRGFLPGRLLGRSSLVWQAEYRWPVWVWLDGVAHYSLGNVFGKHLAGLQAGLLRQSFGLGLRSTAAHDHALEALLAFGTAPLDEGGTVESVRFTFGATSGF